MKYILNNILNNIMHNYLVFIVAIILVLYLTEIGRKNPSRERVMQSRKITSPIYFNIDMNKLCGASGIINTGENNTVTSDEEKYAKLNSCEKKMVKTCPPEKSKDTQIYEQKEIIKNLKLELGDNTPAYRFSKSDRYFLDNGYEGGDDKFVRQMQVMGGRAKEAATARSLWSKNTFIPYLEEELQMHENSGGWWEDQNLENEMYI